MKMKHSTKIKALKLQDAASYVWVEWWSQKSWNGIFFSVCKALKASEDQSLVHLCSYSSKHFSLDCNLEKLGYSLSFLPIAEFSSASPKQHDGVLSDPFSLNTESESLFIFVYRPSAWAILCHLDQHLRPRRAHHTVSLRQMTPPGFITRKKIATGVHRR